MRNLKSLRVLRGLNLASIASLSWVAHGCGPEAIGPPSNLAVRIGIPGNGAWTQPLTLPLVPTAAANLPDGKIIFWAGDSRFDFGQPADLGTSVAVLDPQTLSVVESQPTLHEMFCPGTTNLPDGRLLVAGGSDSGKTSIYDPAVGGGSWTSAAELNIPRAYNANTLLQDGSVFTVGGSWAGGEGRKDGEVWTAASGWRRLFGVPALPLQTSDGEGVYRSDNHMWLVPMGDGRVLHAGPSAQMHWIDTDGDGNVKNAGMRGSDPDSMSGIAVMYDEGKILTAGGSPNYINSNANANVHVIDATGTTLKVQQQPSMGWARVFHNAVVLPNGQVVIIGGQTRALPFNDTGAVLTPELWDPTTGATTPLPVMQQARTYHSLALLLRDGRVLAAGGGLCGTGCGANHPQVEILTPPYLQNADGSLAKRPQILTAAPSGVYGTTVTVTTDAAVSAFSLVRLSSSTHTVNNDQRRVPLRFQPAGNNTYNVNVPTNPGVALPGDYMLFALDADGVPSVAVDFRITAANAPQLASPGDRRAAVGVAASLQLTARGPVASPTMYSSTPLPPPLILNASTGLITGIPSGPGTYAVTVFAENEFGKVSTNFVWNVTASRAPRFARLVEVTERNNGAWGSMAEFNLIGPNGDIPRTTWQVTADNSEYIASNNTASLATDGDPNTIWHTRYSPAGTAPQPPHTFTVDMNASNVVTGFRYLPRSGAGNGSFGQYRFYLSIDGVDWGDPVVQGTFAYGANDPLPKTVMLPPSKVNEPPVVNEPAAQSTAQGQMASLPIVANDPENDAITFSVTGLPVGLSINEATGLISGTVSAPLGAYQVTVSARDSPGLIGTTSFAWTVASPASSITISPVAVAPRLAGTMVTYLAQATGMGLEYAWNFGDGTDQGLYTTAASANHSYATPGIYPVTLSVRASNQQFVTRSFSQAIVTPGVAGISRTSSSIFAQTTATSSRVWVCNPDSSTVTVFGDNAKQAEITVGMAPATLAAAGNGDVWVVNRDSATISVIDANFIVVNTINLPRSSRPFGIVFAANGAAYVTLEATGAVVRISAAGVLEGTAIVGPSPRHLALDAPGSRLLVSRFITGALPGEATATVQTTVAGVSYGGEVAVLPLAAFVKQDTVILHHYDPVSDSTIRARGVPNYVGGAAISPDGTSAWVPSKQDNIKRGQLRDQQQLTFQSTVRAITSRISLTGATALTEQPSQRVDHDNSGVASAAVIHNSGAYVFVALETSRDVAVIDPFAHKELFRFRVGRAPQGLALSPNGLNLYVSNFMDRTVSVIDLGPLINSGESNAPVLRTLATTATEALPANVRLGKQLFYDAADGRLARDAYVSCASCHRDGEQDGRTWDLTGFGEGLRNTISLRGRGVGHGRRHWSANFDEVQDFESQIRTLSGGTGLMTDASFASLQSPLGPPKAGASADLDHLAEYVNSLTVFAASPSRTATGALTAPAVAGRDVFIANCVQCHGGPAFTGSSRMELFNVGTIRPTSGTRLGGALIGFDPPTLRDVWATAPYLHDGSAPTLVDAVAAHTSMTLSTQQIADVSTYVEQAGGDEPALGLTVRAQYIKLQQDTEVGGAMWSSIAELNLTDAAGVSMARQGWTASADSHEMVNVGYLPASAIDGNVNTIWHTQWVGANPGPQHWFVVNLGAINTIGGFRYLPRQDGSNNGTISRFRFFVSADGADWGKPMAAGDFANMGAFRSEKLVLLQ